MSATHKKVVVRFQNGMLTRGYLSDRDFIALSTFNLLLLDGKAITISLREILHIAYVRDFKLDDSIDPERIGIRNFPYKPRSGGLWVRIQFSEADALEGIIRDSGLALIDSLLRDEGVFMEPPNPQGNTQRLFIPRSAMSKFEILAVPGKVTVSKRRNDGSTQRQGGLFELG